MSESAPPAPAELLHPDAAVGSALVLGSGCPDRLAAALPGAGEGAAGLVVVAPGPEEARDPRRLREAAAAAATRVAPDGVVYVLAPAGRRRAVVRALERAGLVREATLVELGRHLATADRRALRLAVDRLLPPSPRRSAAAAVLRLPGGARVARLAAGTAVTLRPPRARPLLAWLHDLVPDADPASAVLTRTWRESRGSTLVHVFGPASADPVAVAKIRPAGSEALQTAEVRALGTVARRARLAGVETPTPLAAATAGGRPVLLASALPGRPAQLERERTPAVLDRLAVWLEAWNRATLAREPFPAAEVGERLAAWVRALAPHLPTAATYEEWVRAHAVSVPAVAAHNDLTTANVLVAADGRLGVVDWESAAERDLPLRDLAYALVDTRLSSGRFASRTAAFDACFAGEGDDARLAASRLARLRGALGLDEAQALACFHACWLEHAVNDLRRVPAAESEFVAIAVRLAREPERFR